MKNFPNLQRLVFLMRFGSSKSPTITKPILNLITISQTLKISVYKVKKILRMRTKDFDT